MRSGSGTSSQRTDPATSGWTATAFTALLGVRRCVNPSIANPGAVASSAAEESRDVVAA